MELYYGITQGNVEWVLEKCAICNANAANREPSTVTPIISKRCLDRIYLDLMDFTSQPDGDYHWILQIKDHFSRYIWLFALKDKSSEEVARSVGFWMSWCGCPKRFYADNGTEFKGELIDLLQQRTPEIPIINGRPYHPQTQGSVEKANGIFKARLAALRAERGLPHAWSKLLPELQEVINITPNRMLPAHTTPFEVFFGRKPHWISTIEQRAILEYVFYSI
jgi:transposase InsO family protein